MDNCVYISIERHAETLRDTHRDGESRPEMHSGLPFQLGSGPACLSITCASVNHLRSAPDAGWSRARARCTPVRLFQPPPVIALRPGGLDSPPRPLGPRDRVSEGPRVPPSWLGCTPGDGQRPKRPAARSAGASGKILSASSPWNRPPARWTLRDGQAFLGGVTSDPTEPTRFLSTLPDGASPRP